MQQTQQHTSQQKVLKVANSTTNGPLNIAPKSGVLSKAKTWPNQVCLNNLVSRNSGGEISKPTRFYVQNLVSSF